MGELEEKETPPSEPTAQHQETVEEPKETDKMLDKKNETELTGAANKDKIPSPSTEKKKSTSSKPTTPVGSDKKSPTSGSPVAQDVAAKQANGGEEIIDIPEGGGPKSTDIVADDKKISKEEREVKPKKIPIGGLKLPGFFMKTKPRADGDGAEGELLEKENKDDSIVATTESKVKKEEKPRSKFGERLRNFFVRKTSAEKQKLAAAAAGGANGVDADAKSGELVTASLIESAFVQFFFFVFQKPQLRLRLSRVPNPLRPLRLPVMRHHKSAVCLMPSSYQLPT